jgi:hypothetical protein
MKPILSALATAVLIAGSMFLGGGAAQATTCPAGYHFNDIGNGVGFCASNPSGGGTGGPIVFDGGGGGGSYGEPMAPPVKQAPSAPVYQAPPAYNPPPAYQGQTGNTPVRGTTPQIQAPPVQNHAPAVGYAPAYTAPGGAAVQPTQGVGANPATGSVAEAGATPADVPADAPTIVLPANEAQAVDALRSATATAAEKDAALAIVKAKVESVLDEAIGKALSNR